MPQRCTVCSHPERSRIEALVFEATPNRQIAKQFGLSEAAVGRHVRAHMIEELARSKEDRAAELLTQLEDLQSRTNALLSHAEVRDPRIALAAVREARNNLRLLHEVGVSADHEQRLQALETARAAHHG